MTATPSAWTAFATCVLCEASCGLQITVENGKATRVEGNEHDVFSKGHICPKAVALEDVRLDPDRVREPFVREGSTRRNVGWQEALGTAASGLKRIQREHGPRAVAVYLGNPMAHNGHGLLGAGVLLAALRQPSALLGDQRRPAAAHARVARDVRAPGPLAHARRGPLPVLPLPRRQPARLERQHHDGARHRATPVRPARARRQARRRRPAAHRDRAPSPTSTTSSAPAPTRCCSWRWCTRSSRASSRARAVCVRT